MCFIELYNDLCNFTKKFILRFFEIFYAFDLDFCKRGFGAQFHRFGSKFATINLGSKRITVKYFFEKFKNRSLCNSFPVFQDSGYFITIFLRS